MTANPQQSPFLREQRQFPRENMRDLSSQIDQSYIDIASKVNSRTIGLYNSISPTSTGEQWYLNNNPTKQSTLRKVYPFTKIQTIPHGIDLNNVDQFSKAYGTFTDGENFYGMIFGTQKKIVDQLTFWIDDVNINLVDGGGLPTIENGMVVLEWIAKA